MKIERVNENKIKVLINDLEAKEWNITIKSISENTPGVQKMFREAIRMAKESIDFSIDGAKLFVETLPDCGGGIGMMITRVCSDEDLKDAVNNCSYKGKLHRTELRPEEVNLPKMKKYIYEFDDFDSVCAAASELCGKFIGLSKLYKMNDKFYLYLVPADTVSLCEAEIVLSEFSNRVIHGQFVHGRLNEYGQLMINLNAIGVLKHYFA